MSDPEILVVEGAGGVYRLMSFTLRILDFNALRTGRHVYTMPPACNGSLPLNITFARFAFPSRTGRSRVHVVAGRSLARRGLFMAGPTCASSWPLSCPAALAARLAVT